VRQTIKFTLCHVFSDSIGIEKRSKLKTAKIGAMVLVRTCIFSE